jgi:mRNA turnover protein 4
VATHVQHSSGRAGRASLHFSRSHAQEQALPARFVGSEGVGALCLAHSCVCCAVTLSQTTKDPKGRKNRLVEGIRTAVDSYERVFLFTYENMRSTPFKELRETMSDSRFFLGSNKVMQVALGRDVDSAYRPGLENLSSVISGQVGLLFTNRSVKDIQGVFEKFGELDYARAGAVATQDIVIPPGPIEDMQHTMVPQLRRLGLPCDLKKGIIHVRAETVVCREGKPLTAEAAHLAKLLAIPMAWFTIVPVAVWDRESEEFTVLREDGLLRASSGPSAFDRHAAASSSAMADDDNDDEDDDE